MLVGLNELMGLPSNLPAGLEKSRCEVRRFNGSVITGVGAPGRLEACFSEVVVAAACCANPEGTPATSVSMTAATARRRMAPDPLDSVVPLLCCLNTPVPYKCMIPLQGSVEACGVPFIKTYGDRLRTQKLSFFGVEARASYPLKQPHIGLYVQGAQFVPAVPTR